MAILPSRPSKHMFFWLLKLVVAPPMPEMTPAAETRDQSLSHSEREMMVTSTPVSNSPERWVFFPFWDSTHSITGLLQPRIWAHTTSGSSGVVVKFGNKEAWAIPVPLGMKRGGFKHSTWTRISCRHVTVKTSGRMMSPSIPSLASQITKTSLGQSSGPYLPVGR